MILVLVGFEEVTAFFHLLNEDAHLPLQVATTGMLRRAVYSCKAIVLMIKEPALFFLCVTILGEKIDLEISLRTCLQFVYPENRIFCFV